MLWTDLSSGSVTTNTRHDSFPRIVIQERKSHSRASKVRLASLRRTALLLMLAVLALCTRPLRTFAEDANQQSLQRQFTLGFIASLTGQYAHLGKLMLAGAELATHDCNTKLSTFNSHLTLRVEDDRLVDNKTTLTIVKKLATVDKPVAILAWAFSTAEAIKMGLGGRKVPVLFFWDANEAIPALGDNFYGMGPAIPNAARVIVEDLQASRVPSIGSFALVDSWTERMNQALQKQSDLSRLPFIGTETLLYDSADYRAPILRLKKQEPGAIAVWSFGSSLITIIKQIRQLWPNVTMYGVGTPESDMQEMGSSGEGMLIVNGWATGTIADRIAQKIAATTGNTGQPKAPSPTELAYGAYAYTSAYVVCQALEKSLQDNTQSADHEKVNTHLRSVSFDAGVGEVAPGRYNYIQERLLEWRGGSFRPVTRR
jgi:ABC-type branched-subunit amino acid transport system substrate-binding protein